MESLKITLVVTIPIVFYLIMLYFLNKKRTPFKEMLITFLFGFVSIKIVDLFLIIFQDFHNVDNKLQLFFHRVAPLEETSKFICLLLVLLLFKKQKEFTLRNDTILKSVVIGLSFAFFENIGYAKHGIDVAVIRNFTSTIAHMFFGYIMGYILTTNTDSYGKVIRLIKYPLSLIVPILCHGIWNYTFSVSVVPFKTLIIMLCFIAMYINLTNKNIN